MRTQIAKAIQRRSTAIQNAVKAYNTAATNLTPPRDTVDWSRVCQYSFLEEFDLLRETRQDIRSRPWAQPIMRQLMRMKQRIAHAYEELTRCDIELRRLLTSIQDEENLFRQVLDSLKASDNPLYVAVESFCSLRRRTNTQVLAHIKATQKLEGFTGNLNAGIRKGMAGITASDPALAAAAAAAAAAATAYEEDENDEEEILGEEDGLLAEINRVAENIFTTD
jgi:septal ring factor EnvC (AmiA/AmiB activator)